MHLAPDQRTRPVYSLRFNLLWFTVDSAPILQVSKTLDQWKVVIHSHVSSEIYNDIKIEGSFRDLAGLVKTGFWGPGVWPLWSLVKTSKCLQMSPNVSKCTSAADAVDLYYIHQYAVANFHRPAHQNMRDFNHVGRWYTVMKLSKFCAFDIHFKGKLHRACTGAVREKIVSFHGSANGKEPGDTRTAPVQAR